MHVVREGQCFFQSHFSLNVVPLWDSASQGEFLRPDLKRCRLTPGRRKIQISAHRFKPGGGIGKTILNLHDTKNFKATALDEDTLRRQEPSIFASWPMAGVSHKYTFVPTSQIVTGLREQNWVPVEAEEQRSRKEGRRGYQKHLIRFRRDEQMQTLDEWNVELVLLNSHDCSCAYQLHAGIYRRVCANGLVKGDFQKPGFSVFGLESWPVIFTSHLLVRANSISRRGCELVGWSLCLGADLYELRRLSAQEFQPDDLFGARQIID